jgi:hypothetical protein
MQGMQKYVFFVFFIGCIAVMALPAAKSAQRQSNSQIAKSCSDHAGIACKLHKPVKSTVLICLKGQTQD